MIRPEKIEDLLETIRELEQSVKAMKEEETYPASFFNQTFRLTHQIAMKLHTMEELQVEALRQEMEEHERLIESKEEILQEQEIPEAIPTETIPEKRTVEADTPPISLNDLLEKRHLSDLRKAFNLNDRFRFLRELFEGDTDKMNKAITDLNGISSYEESISYLTNVLKWDLEEIPVADFIKVLEKRFL